MYYPLILWFRDYSCSSGWPQNCYIAEDDFELRSLARFSLSPFIATQIWMAPSRQTWIRPAILGNYTAPMKMRIPFCLLETSRNHPWCGARKANDPPATTVGLWSNPMVSYTDKICAVACSSKIVGIEHIRANQGFGLLWIRNKKKMVFIFYFFSFEIIFMSFPEMTSWVFTRQWWIPELTFGNSWGNWSFRVCWLGIICLPKHSDTGGLS